MRKMLMLYFHNFAVVITYLAVIAGIVLILVSSTVFCLGAIVAGAVGIFCRSLFALGRPSIGRFV